MFVSRSKSADALSLWATETLFTVQLGNNKDKQLLASNLLNVDVRIIKNIFSKTYSTMPCLYLFELGSLSDPTIRKSFLVNKNDYDDDKYYVNKFGLSNDMPRRSAEHEETYGSMKGVNMKLVCFQYIDPLYLYEAETLLKHLMKKLRFTFSYKKHKELIAYTKDDLKLIREQFQMIGNKFRGRVAEIISINKDLENKFVISDEKHKTTIEKYKNKLLEKDIEIMKLNQTLRENSNNKK